MLVGLIVLLVLNSTTTPSQGTSLVTDRDTGETLTTEHDPTVDVGAAGSDLVGLPTFGMLEFTRALENNKGIYTDYIQIGINDFVNKRFGDKYSTLTIIPNLTRVDAGIISLSLRLGQTDDIVPITITPSLSKESMILRVEDDKNEFGGNFVYIGNLSNGTTLYNIAYTQDYEKSSDPIAITITASTSYREASLDYIRSLGFDLSDFLINFSDYENPFK